MRKILFAGLVVAGALIAALFGPYLLWPSGPDKKPVLAEVPPLQPVTRTSVVIAPTAIALNAKSRICPGSPTSTRCTVTLR